MNKQINKINQLLKDVERESSSSKRQDIIVQILRLLIEIQ